MVTFYGSATEVDYRNLVRMKNCYDKCLQEAMVKAGSLPTQAERDVFLAKAKKLKIELDDLNEQLFHINTAEFEKYVIAFRTLSDSAKAKLAHLEAIVDNLQTAVQIASAIDDALVIAAGVAEKMT